MSIKCNKTQNFHARYNPGSDCVEQNERNCSLRDGEASIKIQFLQ